MFDAKTYQREYYQKYKEKWAARNKARYLADPDWKKKQHKYQHEWRKRDPKRWAEWKAYMREYNKRHREKLKKKILEAYGAVCACCGESQYEFLTLDHINGGGGAHLRKRSAPGVLLDVIRDNFPRDKYQVLCMNCNWARSIHGKCPHATANK